MNVKDHNRYSNAEKIILAEKHWDTISKKEVEVSAEVKRELDIRLKNLGEGKGRLYSWSEVKAHIVQIR